MKLVISVNNPLPIDGIAMYHYTDYLKSQGIKIKRSDKVVIENDCINVYRCR